MGILRDAIGSVLAGDSVNNGFNRSRLPFANSSNNGNTHPYSSSWQGRPLPPRQSQPFPMSYSDDGRLPQDYRASSPFPPSSETKRWSDSNYDSPSHPSYAGSPPPYDPRNRAELMDNTQYNNRGEESYGMIQGRPYDSFNQARDPMRSPSRGFRPLALPQIDYGDGQPFVRGYSDELRQFGISEREFIQTIDAINVAIVPNPEAAIFQKGANIAGWFLPGAASIGLMVGQAGVGIGTAMGYSSVVAKVLSKANLEVFLPHGLEICICKSKDVDAEVGISSLSGRNSISNGTSPESRLAQYGSYIAPLSIALPPLQNSGRSDPIAMLGRGLASRGDKKKAEKAREDAAEGKNKKMDRLQSGLKWLLVRQASPDATAHWQTTLQQSHDATLPQR